MLDTVKNAPVNGLDLGALGEMVEAIEKDATRAKADFNVTTRWTGQTRSESVVDGFTLGGERITRTHKIVADEPCELLGADSAPNPQELLMAAFNACIMVGYVAGASLKGIDLESVEIRTRGQLDLRGFLGLRPFRLLLNDRRFARVPKVLETPKEPAPAADLSNLATLRRLRRDLTARTSRRRAGTA